MGADLLLTQQNPGIGKFLPYLKNGKLLTKTRKDKERCLKVIVNYAESMLPLML